MCVLGCFYATYNLNTELIAAQTELVLLNKKFTSLNGKCEGIRNELFIDQLRQEENDEYDMTTSTDQNNVGGLDDFGLHHPVEETYEEEEMIGGRSRRANNRPRSNARHLKSLGIFIFHLVNF